MTKLFLPAMLSAMIIYMKCYVHVHVGTRFIIIALAMKTIPGTSWEQFIQSMPFSTHKGSSPDMAFSNNAKKFHMTTLTITFLSACNACRFKLNFWTIKVHTSYWNKNGKVCQLCLYCISVVCKQNVPKSSKTYYTLQDLFWTSLGSVRATGLQMLGKVHHVGLH